MLLNVSGKVNTVDPCLSGPRVSGRSEYPAFDSFNSVYVFTTMASCSDVSLKVVIL